jgi:Insect cuticle protein
MFPKTILKKNHCYSFETSDGNKREEEAVLKNAGTDEEAISVKGSFQFKGDDGQTYTVNFVADENGYQPQGAHLPVAPAV